jgi:hypothetical protein
VAMESQMRVDLLPSFDQVSEPRVGSMQPAVLSATSLRKRAAFVISKLRVRALSPTEASLLFLRIGLHRRFALAGDGTFVRDGAPAI